MISPNPTRRALCAFAALALVCFVFFHGQPLARSFKPHLPGPLQGSVPLFRDPAPGGVTDLLNDVYNSTLGVGKPSL